MNKQVRDGKFVIENGGLINPAEERQKPVCEFGYLNFPCCGYFEDGSTFPQRTFWVQTAGFASAAGRGVSEGDKPVSSPQQITMNLAEVVV